MKKNFWTLLCSLLIAGAFCSCTNSKTPNDVQAESRLNTMVKENGPAMLEFGNLNLTIPADSFLNVFKVGDIVSVSILGRNIEVPVVQSYDDVSAGEYLILAQDGDSCITLAENYGQLGVDLGVAKYVKEGDKGSYVLNDSMSLPVNVSVEMKAAGGYLAEIEMRKDMVREYSREFYTDLNDEEYANFRMVRTTGIAEGRLYRSSSPIDPGFGRNTYADSLARNAKVAVFLNLADKETTAKEYDGFSKSYYSTQKVAYLGVPAAFSSEAFKEGLAKGLRFIIDNEGPYLEHCKEGKDRAGFVAAVLEGLMGASLEEIKADYLKTYTNYFKVKDGAHVQLDSAQTAWAIGIIVHNIQRFYVKAGVDSLSVVNARTGAEMSAITESYLQKLGLNNDEISKLKSRLAE